MEDISSFEKALDEVVGDITTSHIHSFTKVGKHTTFINCSDVSSIIATVYHQTSQEPWSVRETKITLADIIGRETLGSKC